MGSSTDGQAASQSAMQEPAEDERPEAATRGFLGRILSAFSPSTDAEGTPDAPLTAQGSAGLGALRRLRVDDVAIPKAEITAVPLDIGKDDLVEMFREHGFSRMPVYKGTLDHPQGLVLLKDLALTHGFGAGGRFSLKRLLRPILYAPPSMPSGVLLQKMQKERVHMALVIDEYGGVDGLVTIEDLIETVIGEIDDEHDEVEGALWKAEAPGVILAQSTAPLEEIEAALEMKLRADGEGEDVDTIGGLVFLRMGRVPARGEVLDHESGAQIEIVDADPRRIKRLRIRRHAEPVAEAEAVAVLR
ncbi:transporter associated domain-containing protein [Xinfangfangia sp. CPCC 101601]|uniref:Transporter associated domain-containing protein n=1 Tax=Pseudogemmobacter lacusdianii TaxID=3069608 RepID=A0ABU0VWD5_9RHOB|nr:transporter associated domain-containing protein [Xinfangfangia sp. CPCC 101601]MDQ2066067.1 transporter associated domain-containing protein [Xinfangfangia sp. CPCC 101601]